MSRWIALCCLNSLLWIGIPSSFADPAVSQFHFSCTNGESWDYGTDLTSEIPAEFLKEFELFLRGKTSPLRGFAEALALRGQAVTDLEKMFSEYWISRALFEGDLIEVSLSGFNSLITTPESSNPTSTETHSSNLGNPSETVKAIQIAALNCVNKIHSDFPVLGFSDEAIHAIDDLRLNLQKKPLSKSYSAVLWDSITSVFLSLLEKGTPPAELHRWVGLLNGSGVYQVYASALLSVFLKKHSEAIPKLSALLSQSNLPESIEKQRPSLQMILARSEYIVGRYKEAEGDFILENKNSNEFTSSLLGLAWASLFAKDYNNAVGVGISTQSSWMRQTFSPEPLMVAAMAFNEICHYPQAFHMIQTFRASYRKVYEWLKQSLALDSKQNSKELYPLAIEFIKKSPAGSGIPQKIASEWIRSPLFLSYQEGINLLFQEKKSIHQLYREGYLEEIGQVRFLLKKVKEFRENYKHFKANRQNGEPLSPSLVAQYGVIQEALVHYRRFGQAAGVWDQVVNHLVQTSASSQALWLQKIETELRTISLRLYQTIVQVSETIDLIEIEVLNHGGDDIVRLHASSKRQKALTHSQELAKSKAELKDSGESESDLYQWGEHSTDLNGSGEVWEDELDSLKVRLVNQCPDHLVPSRKRK